MERFRVGMTSEGNYPIRYVCASKGSKTRKETYHRLNHLATATGNRDVIQWVRTEENKCRVSIL
jgi:hypothetical protein